MSLMSDSRIGIQSLTGVKPKGRKFEIKLNDKNSVTFELRAKEMLVFLNGGHEQTVSMDRAVSYVRGYLFSQGYIDNNGQKVTSTKQAKRNHTMATKSNNTKKSKTTSRAAAVAAKRRAERKGPAKKAQGKAPAKKAPVKQTGKGYSLGTVSTKSASTKLIKELSKEHPDGMTFTAAAREAIKADLDNDLCIGVTEEMCGYEGIVPADINKVRRAMKRKGEWK